MKLVTCRFAPALLVALGLVGTACAIYGQDTRVEAAVGARRFRGASLRSVAALIHRSNISARGADGNVRLRTTTLKVTEGLCPDAAFADQPAAAGCSAVLVAPDRILTAAHCVPELEREQWAVVFDFALVPGGDPTVLPSDNVYGIAKSLERDAGNDWEVFALDRPTSNRPPAVAAPTPPARGDEVFVIGFPSGLPMKLADRGRIKSVSAAGVVAELNAFEGNSGAPVFDMRSQLVGITVAGGVDYVLDYERRCNVPNICSPRTCSGETVTFVPPQWVVKAR